MPTTDKDAQGPFILWMDLGYDGWSPRSFKTLKEALETEKYSTEWVITKTVEYNVEEK